MPSPTPFPPRRQRPAATYRNGGRYPTKAMRAKWERDAYARTLAPVLDALAGAGVTGNREIAAALAAHGVPSESGRPWAIHTVAALRTRLRLLAEARTYAGKA